MIHGLHNQQPIGQQMPTDLSSLHQADDGGLVDELAVLVDLMQDLVRLRSLLSSDGRVEVDTDL